MTNGKDSLWSGDACDEKANRCEECASYRAEIERWSEVEGKHDEFMQIKEMLTPRKA